MKLTELIFYHWKIWMTVPEKTNEWVLIHGGRAHQSRAFLKQARDLVNEMKKELN